MSVTSEACFSAAPTPATKRSLWVAVLALLAIAYLAVNFLLSNIPIAELNIYLAQPVLWVTLCIVSFLGWKDGLDERPTLTKGLAFMALLIGAAQIAMLVLAGLVLGFGYSPYSHKPLPLLGNILYVGTSLAGIEMSRAYLLARFGKRNPMIALVVFTLVFAFMSIPAGKYTALGEPQSAFRIVGGSFLPALSENILASFLAMLGGPIPALLYLGSLSAFEWLSPILPKLHWAVTAFIGTIAPIIGLLILRGAYLPESPADEQTRNQPSKTISTLWLVTGVFAVGLLWFNTGLFGFRPFVVVGDSMEPTLLAGDMVITRTVPAESIQVGDVIRFQRNKAFVLHRVIDIQKGDAGVVFITRGDGNNTDDPPVTEDMLEGKAIFTIPKIGWFNIAVRSALQWLR